MHNPQGILMIIGGNIYIPNGENGTEEVEKPEFFESGILKTFVDKLPGETHKIEIIPTASTVPKEAGQAYVKALKALGYDKVRVLDIQTREEAQAKNTVKRIKEADGVLFTGGNQLRLTTILGGTEFLNVLHERYVQEPIVIAGTSAGAMAMSDTMIYEGTSHEALLKGEVKFSSGFGFVSNVIIDSHFVKRGRIGRLFQAVAANPAALGIGLGEDTGLMISDGNIKEAIGSGLIMVVDGYNIRHTNIAHIHEGDPISIENLSVHVMIPGDRFILSERKFDRGE